MRTTLILQDDLLMKAKSLTQIEEKTALVHAGLKALIEKYARKRLAFLGGSDKSAKAPRRKR
ncbi:MAG: type II toxin-antitoxin system VapB family antitoxin [Deltaproteobacteria bacterium]|nr:type II toxin-antitoxin system VapB family antitoxin [Deltaproteobacteria bacterium]